MAAAWAPWSAFLFLSASFCGPECCTVANASCQAAFPHLIRLQPPLHSCKTRPATSIISFSCFFQCSLVPAQAFDGSCQQKLLLLL